MEYFVIFLEKNMLYKYIFTINNHQMTSEDSYQVNPSFTARKKKGKTYSDASAEYAWIHHEKQDSGRTHIRAVECRY